MVSLLPVGEPGAPPAATAGARPVEGHSVGGRRPPERASAQRYRALVDQIAPFPAAKLRGTGAPKARVDEVVLPPHEPAASGGGASPLPWVGGALALAGGLVLLLRRRGLPWARPSEG